MTDAAPREGWYIVTSDSGYDYPIFYSEERREFQFGDALDTRNSQLPPGWTLGPRIDDLLRDAARYRWLREHRQIEPPRRNRYPRVTEQEDAALDALIDAEISWEKGRADG